MNRPAGADVPDKRIVAVALLTETDLTLLGPTFDRVWPVEDAPGFSGLLEAIDEADRALCRERDALRSEQTENYLRRIKAKAKPRLGGRWSAPFDWER